MSDHILAENRSYWTNRSESYSEINRQELTGHNHTSWQTLLHDQIQEHFPDTPSGDLHILEVGTGPGFFAILMAELGYDVTAIDLTASMLEQAKRNAGILENKIRFIEMNAEELSFDSHSFDIILTRNLTWNLPHPEKAYSEWHRVLKSGGLLLNFDANWYQYLFDKEAQQAYQMDRYNSREKGISDQNVGQNFDIMEAIAARLPLSDRKRPAWDLDILTTLGMHVSARTDIWKQVWSEEEKINFASTPMFMVKAICI